MILLDLQITWLVALRQPLRIPLDALGHRPLLDGLDVLDRVLHYLLLRIGVEVQALPLRRIFVRLFVQLRRRNDTLPLVADLIVTVLRI